jgi:hypothetical protein
MRPTKSLKEQVGKELTDTQTLVDDGKKLTLAAKNNPT